MRSLIGAVTCVALAGLAPVMLWAGDAPGDSPPAAEAPHPLLGVTPAETAGSQSLLTDSALGSMMPPAVIGSVVKGSTANHMGLLPGDTITRINGHPIKDFGDVRKAVLAEKIGDPITIELQRTLQDKTQSKTLTGVLQGPGGPKAGAKEEDIQP